LTFSIYLTKYLSLFKINMLQETKKRTLVRALTWRCTAFIITITVSFLFTGSFNKAMEIGLVDSSIKLISHFIHDRLWLKTTCWLKPSSSPEEKSIP